LPGAEQQKWLKKFYHPYRKSILKWINKEFSKNRSVMHISIHSFTPVWKGRLRPTEIGILFDPNAKAEAKFARAWQRNLKKQSNLVIHANRPYRGIGDGQTSELRSRFKSSSSYCGIEIEINQKFLSGPRRDQNIKYLANLLLKTMPPLGSTKGSLAL
jgi:predicted N-formylglutamate amidohydrolase